jgi:spore germination protein
MSRLLGRSLFGVLVVLTVALAHLSYAATDASQTTDGRVGALAVEGYVAGWGAGAKAYLSDRRTVDLAGVDGVELRTSGDEVTPVLVPAKKALHVVHRHHDRAELLLSNYSNAIGDFDPALAHRMLTSESRRTDVVAALAGIVRRQGWDGVQIDLESLHRNDGRGLASFADELRAALPTDAALSMAVMAESSHASYAHHGYRLGKLGAIDRFVLMAYDQHGPGWSGPGPVGALPWSRRSAAPLVAAVGPDRVDLGISGYGYLWRTDGSGRTVSDAKARRLAGLAARWHERAGEWSAHTARGTLWWSDHRSYLRRLALARHLGLHGVAVWQLASADPLGR